MPRFNIHPSPTLDRGVAAACYLSCGLIGLLYVLLSGRNARTAPFFYFHFLQSIVLGILSFLLSWTGDILKHIVMGMLGLIFALLPGGTTIDMFIGSGIDWLLLLINTVLYILMIYGLVFALLGKYAEIPGLSSLVRKNM